MRMFSLQYVFSCVSSSYLTKRKICDSWSREKASCQSESVCVSSGDRTGRFIWCNYCMKMFYLRCGFFHVSSVLQKWKKLFCRLSRKMTSLQNGCGCELLVYLEQRRLCDILHRCAPWSNLVGEVLPGERIRMLQFKRWNKDKWPKDYKFNLTIFKQSRVFSKLTFLPAIE